MHHLDFIRTYCLWVVFLLCGALIPQALGQGNQSVTLAVGDFRGVVKQPALLPALSQQISATLGSHPSIKVVPRGLLQSQSGGQTIYSENAGNLGTSLQAGVLQVGS